MTKYQLEFVDLDNPMRWVPQGEPKDTLTEATILGLRQRRPSDMRVVPVETSDDTCERKHGLWTADNENPIKDLDTMIKEYKTKKLGVGSVKYSYLKACVAAGWLTEEDLEISINSDYVARCYAIEEENNG